MKTITNQTHSQRTRALIAQDEGRFLPWRLLNGCIFNDAGKQVGTVYQLDDCNASINGDATDEANAEFKVRAVNCHDELLQRIHGLNNALLSWANMAQHGTKALHGYDKRTIELMILGSRTEVEEARAAIARAEDQS